MSSICRLMGCAWIGQADPVIGATASSRAQRDFEELGIELETLP